jgi:hypothetical protein
MKRVVELLAVLALASVRHADAACADTQKFAPLQPSVRAFETRTRAWNVAHDTPNLEGTTAHIAK